MATGGGYFVYLSLGSVADTTLPFDTMCMQKASIGQLDVLRAVAAIPKAALSMEYHECPRYGESGSSKMEVFIRAQS